MVEKKEIHQEWESPPVKTILIVDDDTDIGNFMVEVIQQETPYQALAATNGFHALKLVGSITPQAFIIDYLMPVMNGLELYERLLHIEAFQHAPVLFTSANAPPASVSTTSSPLYSKAV